ncbi:MAG: ASCH domain-containing protein [Alphaproteobacteria bacterium]|nr:ASCH domain-containing protein [Alphaproteobacteria bacterium]
MPDIGINVRSDGDIDYADLIVDGKKKLETRNSDSLRPYVGKRVSIVKTGKGRAYAIGVATVGEPIVADEEEFRKLEKEHLVPAGSKFDIYPGQTKFLYPMLNPKRYERPREVGHGIVSRKVFVEDGNGKLAWRIRFRRFKGMPSYMPEREGKVYLMPTDHSALRTFGNLTGKDDEKITQMPTEAYLVSGDAMVGDMSIINAISRETKTTNNQDRIEQLKKLYLNYRVPYSQYKSGMYKYPEILADPSQLTKLDKSVVYDRNTGEIVFKDKKYDTNKPRR